MKDTDYLAISTRVRVLEGRLLTPARQEQFRSAPSDEGRRQLLAACGYPTPAQLTAAGVGESLSQARTDLFADLKKAVPQPELVEVFQVPYDYHNAKVLLKSAALGEDNGRLLSAGGRFDPAQLSAALPDGDTAELPEAFHLACGQAWTALAEERDPRKADMILDRACYGEMTRLAQESGSPFLQGYVRLTIDALNLRTAVRCWRTGEEALLPEALLPGGDTDPGAILNAGPEGLRPLFAHTALSEAAQQGGELAKPGSRGLSQLERSCDKALEDYLAQARYVPFGDAPVVAYLARREREAGAIRSLLTRPVGAGQSTPAQGGDGHG